MTNKVVLKYDHKNSYEMTTRKVLRNYEVIKMSSSLQNTTNVIGQNKTSKLI